MPNTTPHCFLIDDFLPSYDVSASYETGIRAPRPAVYDSVLRSDFSELWILRLLMTLRTGKRMSRQRDGASLPQRLQGTGFVLLSEVPERELVIGVAGKFWRPDGGRCFDLAANDFVPFSRNGYAKAVWNFKLEENSQEETTLTTETRIQCFGREALWKFRTYWTAVGPFSGLIRKAMLKQVKRQAELVVKTSGTESSLTNGSL